jgi:two-component system, response regulator
MSILLIEDDPRDARLTVRELQSEGGSAQIDVVRDGEEALDFLFCRGPYGERSLDHPPNLILLDLKLPKVDGLQVLREIKTRPETRLIPVVALTSSREEKDMAACYRLGVNSYIQKPMDFDQFREAIKALGFYWIKLNEAPPEMAFKTH